MSQSSLAVPSASSPYKIFLSYRRSDSQATVDHIFEWLVRAFGREVIFKDVDTIPRGYEFAPYITHVLSQCRVALLALGPSWPTVLATEGAYSGRPRLDDPEDHVRIETEQALALAPVNATGAPASALLLIPVLVQGAQMPHPGDLPASLQPLCRRNATPVRYDPDFTRDMQRLISDCAHWMGVPVPDLLGANHTPASLRPPDEVDAFLAVATPQIRDAFSAQNWAQVIRQAKALPLQVPAERVPTEVYQMWGRALMAMRDYGGAKTAWDTVRQREPRDVAALRAAAEARVELNEQAEALTLLDGALLLTQGDAQQQVALLAIYAHILRELAQSERGAAAQAHWANLLRVVNERQSLAGTQDTTWLIMKLEALRGSGRDVEALEVLEEARALTARASATAAQWLTRARLAWTLAGEAPNVEVRVAIGNASRLAPADGAIALERQLLLKETLTPPISVRSDGSAEIAMRDMAIVGFGTLVLK